MKLIVAITALVSLSAVALALGQAPAAPARPQGVREVTVTAIPGVVAAGAVWTRAWQGTDNADGLVGAADGGLLFAQEQPSRISKLDARSDKASVVVEDTHGTGSIGVDAQGRIVAVQRTCTDPGLAPAPCSEPTSIAVIYPVKDRKILASEYQGKTLGRINDLVIARNGGVYFTSGGAFYVNPAGQVATVGENLRTNGIMLSRDGQTLYVTNGPAVVAFDVAADGTTRNQRDFGMLEAGGGGDGMAIDADGRLYVTSAAGVQVLTQDGKYLGLIPTPRSVISVAFAGPDKKTMYVVGSGALNADGSEATTPPGVRNNAKTIFRIPMVAQGFKGRAK